MHVKRWDVTLNLFEDEEHTRAEAVLHTGTGAVVRHTGTARRHPGDRDVPEIGDELAVARALHGLAENLLAATSADVWDNDPTGGPPLIRVT